MTSDGFLEEKQNLCEENFVRCISVTKITTDAELAEKSTTVVPKFSLRKKQMAFGAIMLLQIGAGLTVGYSAVLLPQLNDPKSSLYANREMGSWIASLAVVPMALSYPFCCSMMDYFGRRKTILILCVLFTVGWLFFALANIMSNILVGRFFCGLCAGLATPLASVYISEITSPKDKGLISFWLLLFNVIGIFIVHLLGTYLDWQVTALICAVIPLISYILMRFAPESPYWLISQGLIGEGVMSFAWMRGNSPATLMELMTFLEKPIKPEPPDGTVKTKYWTSPQLWRPLLVMLVLLVTTQLCGIHAVTFYSVTIMERVFAGSIDGHTATLAIDILRIVLIEIAFILAKRYNRRPLVILSGFVAALSLFGLSALLYWSRVIPPQLAWVHLLLLSLFIFSANTILMPLSWLICYEIFSERFRRFGLGVGAFIGFTSIFMVVKTAPAMMELWGIAFTFFTYGSFAFVGTCVLFFILPETNKITNRITVHG